MKTLNCRDAGFDCNGVIQANTDEEVLAKAGQHASEVHGIEVTPEMAAQLKTLIRDDGANATI
jgi:predicted small metal-binding protein